MNQLKLQLTGFLFFSILFGGFPEIITDIDGNPINLKELTTQKTVAVITMKAPDCPVCQTQILRIMQNFDKLSVCNVTFLVLAPEPVEKLQKASLVSDNYLKRPRNLFTAILDIGTIRRKQWRNSKISSCDKTALISKTYCVAVTINPIRRFEPNNRYRGPD